MTADAVLVVGPSWVGDMVMAQSLFKTLKDRRPDSAIDVLAPAWSLPVLQRMPEVRTAISIPVKHGELAIATRRRLGHSLRGQYARAIILPRSLKSALVPWFARIRRRTGYRGEMRYGVVNDIRPLDRALLDQTVKRFVALGLDAGERLAAVPQPALTISAVNRQAIMGKLGLDDGRPVVAMMPGAEYGPAKCWPLENFTTLAGMLDADGYAVWVLGSERDREAGLQIAAAGNARNLCGQTSLADAIDLLAGCRAAVSNDSGLMHVAAAAGTHVVAIYGSSSPAYTPPLTARSSIHYLALPCSPCFERQCPLGHLRCLRDLGPGQVRASICS
ncbi:MAG: lipopolysaccharide heptosyltransferase II [Woeseiaceae bacterium]